MPTYEYACTSCGEHLEVVQSFTDPALTTCPNCGGSLRKVFGSIGVVLKGSGFYKTDNRTSRNGSSPAKSGSGSSAEGSGASAEGSGSSAGSSGASSGSTGSGGGSSGSPSSPSTPTSKAAAS